MILCRVNIDKLQLYIFVYNSAHMQSNRPNKFVQIFNF